MVFFTLLFLLHLALATDLENAIFDLDFNVIFFDLWQFCFDLEFILIFGHIDQRGPLGNAEIPVAVVARACTSK